jgi:hypothetical protein
MPLYKICPSCGTKNTPSEMICTNPDCLADLSRVRPVEFQEGTPEPAIALSTAGEAERHGQVCPGEKTLVDEGVSVTLIIDGQEIPVRNGDIIGRHHKGKEVLKDYMTVSRAHAQIFIEGENVYIVDLESTNGVLINGVKIPPNTRYRIADGSVVHLSSRVRAEVRTRKGVSG